MRSNRKLPLIFHIQLVLVLFFTEFIYQTQNIELKEISPRKRTFSDNVNRLQDVTKKTSLQSRCAENPSFMIILTAKAKPKMPRNPLNHLIVADAYLLTSLNTNYLQFRGNLYATAN